MKRKYLLSNFILFLAIFILGCSKKENISDLESLNNKNKIVTKAMDYIDDPDPYKRQQALFLIGKYGGSKAGELSMPSLDDTVKNVRMEALKNIANTFYQPAFSKILYNFGKFDIEENQYYALALENLGSKNGNAIIEHYLNLQNDPSKAKVLSSIEEQLYLMPRSYLSAATKRLMKSKEPETSQLLKMLGLSQSAKNFKLFVGLLGNDKYAQNSIDYIQSIRPFQNREVQESLISISADNTKVITILRMVQILGNIGDGSNLALLESISKSRNNVLVEAANQAIFKIKRRIESLSPVN